MIWFPTSFTLPILELAILSFCLSIFKGVLYEILTEAVSLETNPYRPFLEKVQQQQQIKGKEISGLMGLAYDNLLVEKGLRERLGRWQLNSFVP